MRILVLSYYFEPDIAPGAFRNASVVDALAEKLQKHDSIDVISTAPNRFHSYEKPAKSEEVRGPVTIYRVKVPEHRSGFRDRARAFFHYARGVLRVTRGRQYDLLFASSSRLMTGVLGAHIAARTGAKLYLDIRDIFTESIADVLGSSPARALLLGFRPLERYMLRRASRINLVSLGFRPYFERVMPDKDYRFYPNGIDSIFVQLDRPGRNMGSTSRASPQIVYAGNMGEGQGLHRIIPEAAKHLDNYRFLLVGDGGRRVELEKAIERAGVKNVTIRKPVPRDQLIDIYAKADFLLLHLNDYPAFRRVLPSKIFEYAATGKPILAGVGGYAAEFIQDHVENSAVFRPCDAASMQSALASLRRGEVARIDFIARFRRDVVISEFADDILALGRAS